jgi:hypothetical protein
MAEADASIDAPPSSYCGGVARAGVATANPAAGLPSAVQYEQLRHLQNLQWLPALGALQKEPHAMNGRSPFSSVAHLVFWAADELPLPFVFAFFPFLGQRGGGGAFLRKDGLSAGGDDAEESIAEESAAAESTAEESPAQKVHALHLQNLQ